jgi:hypothetical protein
MQTPWLPGGSQASQPWLHGRSQQNPSTQGRPAHSSPLRHDTRGYRGFLGEFGAAANDTCSAAVDDLLDHLEANRDVWLGWAWWAAGPWWGDYMFTLEPEDGTDRPQMDVLEPHL